MATSSTTTTTRRSWHWWVNAVSFVSVAIIGIVLFFSVVLDLNGSIFEMLNTIANALAYIVVAACSFVYVSGKFRKKRGWVYMLIWIVAVILITLAYIVPLAR